MYGFISGHIVFFYEKALSLSLLKWMFGEDTSKVQRNHVTVIQEISCTGLFLLLFLSKGTRQTFFLRDKNYNY